MADSKYKIDIVVEAQDKTRDALTNLGKNFENLKKLADNLTTSIEDNADARTRLAETTTDEIQRQKELNDTYEQQGDLTRQTAREQQNLARAAREYARVRRDIKSEIEDEAVAEQNLASARRRLNKSYEEEVLSQDAGYQNLIKTIKETNDAEEKLSLERERRSLKKQLLDEDEQYQRRIIQSEELEGERRLSEEQRITNAETTRGFNERIRKEREIAAEIKRLGNESRKNGLLTSTANKQLLKEIEDLKKAYIDLSAEDSKGNKKKIDSARRTKAINDLVASSTMNVTDEISRQYKEAQSLLDIQEKIEKLNQKKASATTSGSSGEALRAETQRAALSAELDRRRRELTSASKNLATGSTREEFQVVAKTDAESFAKVQAVKKILGRRVDFKVKADVDTAKGRDGLQRVAGQFNDLWASFNNGIQKSNRGVAAFDNLIRGLLTLTIAVFLNQLIFLVLGLSSALAALASSAVAAGAALGGGLAAGLAQAIPAIGVLGAFVNRISKVFGALKQSNLEQQQASYSGAKAADTQAKSLSGVADAQKALTEARKAAKKALEDLIFAEKGQALSAEEAGFALQKAISSGQGSLATARAQLNVESANKDLSKTRSEISSRKKSGIEGSPEVKAALKNVEAAQQGAQAGGGQVLSAAGKLNFLTSQLSKEEKRLYSALIRLQEAWRKFAESITAPLTNSFTFAVNRVTKILENKSIINAGKRISESLGTAFTTIFDKLLSSDVVNRFIMFGDEYIKSLKPLTRIAVNLIDIFLNIAEAGNPVLAKILGYFDDLIKRFADFTNSTNGKNGIKDFFEVGTQALLKFFDLAGALGNVVIALIGGPGSGLGLDAGTKVLDQLIKSINTFAKDIKDPTTKTGEFFTRFFYYADKILPTFGPVFSAIGNLISSAFTEKGLDSLKTFSTFVAEVLIPGFQYFLGFFGTLTDKFLKFTQAIGGTKVLAVLLGLVLSTSLALKAFDILLGKVVFHLGQVVLFGSGKKSAFALLGSEADSARGKVGKLLDAIEKSNSIYKKPFKASNERLKAVEAAAAAPPRDPVTGQFLPLSSKSEPNARPMTKRVTGVGKRVLQGAGFMGGADAIEGGAGMAAKFGALLGSAGLVAIAIAAITALIVGLIAYSGRLGDVWKQIKKTFNEVWASIKKGAGDIAKEITGKNSIKEAFSDISKFAKKVGNALADAVIWLTKAYGDVAKKQIEALVQTIIAVVRAVKWTIEAFKDVQHWLKEAGKDIRGFFTGIWDGILTGLESVTNGIISAVKRAADAFNKLPSAVRLGQTIDTSGLNPVDLKTSTEKAAEKRAVKAAQKADRENTYGRGSRRFDTSGVDSGVKSDTGTRRSPSASGEQRRTPGKDQSPARPKAATKADNKDATSFLNTFDPETVQLSDAIVKKLSHYWKTLRKAAKDSINDVIDFLKDLRGSKGNGRVDKFATLAISDFKRLRNGVRTNMEGISNIVKNQMQNSMEAVHDAAVYMRETLKQALKDVGAESIDITVKSPPKVTGDAAQGHATGGWIGNRGERGQDAVHAILGRGEAVLNWGQQKVVEPALRQVYGFGLDEMFGRTKGTHAGTGRATGGFARGGRSGSGGQDITATVFGSEGDFYDTSDANDPLTAAGIGYTGANMRAIKWVWGEIGNIALGGKPPGYKFKVSHRGKSAVLGKYDRNNGANLGRAAMDIWIHAARYLSNFQKVGMGTVHIDPVSQSTALGPTDGSGGGGGDAATLKMPKITGGNSPIGKFVTKGTKKMMDGAQKYLDDHTPTIDAPAGGGGGLGQRGSASGGGYGSIDGYQVANWIIPILNWARQHGWTGQVTSGYRSHAHNVAQGRNYISNHESSNYPGGAIDVGGYGSYAEGRQLRNVLKGYRGPRNLVWALDVGNDDGGHFSANGRARGGFVGLQQFAHGGNVMGPDGQAVPIVAHAGEWVVNKMQQSKLAAMAGTSVEKVKNTLGFSGGQEQFAKREEVKSSAASNYKNLERQGQKLSNKIWSFLVGKGAFKRSSSPNVEISKLGNGWIAAYYGPGQNSGRKNLYVSPKSFNKTYKDQLAHAIMHEQVHSQQNKKYSNLNFLEVSEGGAELFTKHWLPKLGYNFRFLSNTYKKYADFTKYVMGNKWANFQQGRGVFSRPGPKFKPYAMGGNVEGPEGQAVPIVAHAGEWVVNKMQQAKLAMMAGTTPDRVKGALGFGGGPTHFKDGGTVERNRSGSVRTVNKDGSLNLLDIPAFDIQSYFSSFQKAFDKAFMFIDKQIKTLSSSSRIERQIKQAEKRIERLKRGDESDKQQRTIDKLEERVKTLNEKLLKKDIDTLLKSIRKLTADGGAFSQLADKITRQFDRATSAANLAAVGLTKIGTRLKKLTTGAAFEKAIDPEEIAKAEATLQDLLSERLQNLRTDWVRTLKRVDSIIKKTKIGTSEKIQKTLQKLNGDVQSIQSKIDKAEEGDESEAEKKRIERLKKSLKAKKEQIKKQETNLKKRQALDTEAITAQDKITEIENKIIEAENAALEARKTAFEEATKKALKKTERNSVVASLRKGLAELGAAIDLATGGIFDITDPVKTTIDALQSTAIEAQKKYDILKSRLAEAKKKALADPRWQSVVDDLEQQVGDSALAVVQTQADVVSGAIAAIDAQFQRGETTRALTERAAAVNERIGNNAAAYSDRLNNSNQKGAGLQTQLDLLKSLSTAGLNKQQIDDLNIKIRDLTIAVDENSQDTIDLTRQYRQAQLDLVTGKATRTTGLLGSVGTIFGNIAKAIGSTQSTASQITIAEQIRTALGLEQTGIIQQIIQAISDSNLGTEANTVLAQLQAAFSSGDPNSFATVLQALAPEIARLDSTLGTTAKATFDALVDSMINNTIATTDNTSNLAELNGLANQPQQFATTAWTKFRTALFNGVGDILPQFQVPQMATGGAITKGGLFQLHPGEFVINADKSNIPSDGPINITVNEANKPLDVTALASRIAFEKRTRR